MEKTTQWRYTPPTHVVAAFDSAISQYLEEGGLPARGARYAPNGRTLIAGMAKLGLRSFLPAAIQAPIIVTFHAPDSPRYAFRSFYDAVKAHGYVLYPGKLTTLETFRVGCMRQLGERGLAGAVDAVGKVLAEVQARPEPAPQAREPGGGDAPRRTRRRSPTRVARWRWLPPKTSCASSWAMSCAASASPRRRPIRPRSKNTASTGCCSWSA